MVKKCALLFSLYGIIFFAMDTKSSALSSNQQLQQPKTTKTLFNYESYCNRSVPWSSVMPEKIFITPDGKGLVMARKGEVLLFSFLDPKTGLQITEPMSIITHSGSHKAPKMVVVEAENKSLVIASAINYKKPNVENYFSEYALYHNESYKVEKLKWLIYAIALDKTGKMLAIAGSNKIEVVDFTNNRRCRIVIPDIKEDVFLVDIAINLEAKTERPVVVVDNHGNLRAMGLNQEGDNFSLFRWPLWQTGDIIKKLLYSDSGSLSYITNDDEIKKLDAYAILGAELGEKKPIASCPPSCKLAVFYTGDCLTTAHWDRNNKQELHIRDKITIRRQGKQLEEVVLNVPFRREQYRYRTKDGILKTGNNCISLVALSHHCGIALTKDGVLYRWDLRESNESVAAVNEAMTAIAALSNISPEAIKSSDLGKRKRSLFQIKASSSGSNSKEPILQAKSADQEKQNESIKNDRQQRRRSKSHSGEYSEALQKTFESLARISEQSIGSIVEDSAFKSDSIACVTNRREQQSKSLPEQNSKVQRERARSVSTAPAGSNPVRDSALSPSRTKDQKTQKTSPRVDALKKGSDYKSSKTSRDNSPRSSSKSRSSSTSPRSRSNSIVDVKNHENQAS